MTKRRRREFGEDVLESGKADSEMAGLVGRQVIGYIIMAIVGTGFGTLGLLRLFAAH